MRFIFQGNFKDGNGLTVQDGTVTVNLAGTSTAATIYSASSGGSPITNAQITTDSAGYFKFYVDDADHTSEQLFDIVLSESSLVTKTYANVRIVESIAVIATASLPAAAASQNGKIVIEDVGAGDRNLIIYAGGERFRIDGGAAF